MRCLSILFLFLLNSSAWADKYYFTLFSHDSKVPIPFTCHVWGTWVKTSGKGLLEEKTISWQPVGHWGMFDRAKKGYNLDLKESLEFAQSKKRVIRYWGPYEVSKDFYDQAASRWESLPQSHEYKALDAFSRSKGKPAVNCFHAVSDIPGNLKTHVRFGVWAGEGIYQHFKKHNLIDCPKEDVSCLFMLDKFKATKRK